MLLLKISSFFILTIHASKDQQAHHKSGYSNYVSDDESKVKVRLRKMAIMIADRNQNGRYRKSPLDIMTVTQNDPYQK